MKPFYFLKTVSNNSVQLIRKTPPLVFAMAVLSFGGFIGASTVLVTGLRTVENSITVTGASTESIESDMAKWKVRVKTNGSSQIDSYNKHQKSMDKVLKFLTANGIGIIKDKNESMEIGPAYTSKKEVRNPKTGVLISTNWVTSQWIEIQSNDVSKIDKTHRKSSELLGQGVLISSHDPKFTFTKLAEKRVDMLAKATKDARIRAQAIAREAGSSIGAVKRVNTGVFQITVPNSTKVSSWGSYDTSTIRKDITAVMSVVFGVEK